MPGRKKSSSASSSHAGDQRPDDPVAEAQSAPPDASLLHQPSTTGQSPRVRSISPSIAAFRAGRLLNALNFYAQQVWLLGGGPEQDARRIQGQLAREVRLLVPVEERRKSQAWVSRKIGRLIDQIHTEGHAEALSQSNHELNVRNDIDLCGERESILRPVFKAVDEVRRRIERSLDDSTRLILHLGVIVDQTIHPPDVHEYLYEPEAPPRRAEGGELRRLTPGLPPRRDQEPRSYLANTIRRPGELPPKEDWAAEVEQVLLELGLIETLPQEVLDQARRITKADSADTVVRLSEAILDALGRPDPGTEAVRNLRVEDGEEGWRANARLGQVPFRPVFPTPSTAGPVFDEEDPGGRPQDRPDSRHQAVEPSSVDPPSIEAHTEASTAERGPNSSQFLGIRLDEQNHVVSRAGSSKSVKLNGKLGWGILKKLIQARGSSCSCDMLLQVWGWAALQESPDKNNVKEAVRELRSRLKPLGLAIRNRRGVGWRLQDVESAEET